MMLFAEGEKREIEQLTMAGGDWRAAAAVV
jgi:hypothetical protein